MKTFKYLDSLFDTKQGAETFVNNRKKLPRQNGGNQLG